MSNKKSNNVAIVPLNLYQEMIDLMQEAKAKDVKNLERTLKGNIQMVDWNLISDAVNKGVAYEREQAEQKGKEEAKENLTEA